MHFSSYICVIKSILLINVCKGTVFYYKKWASKRENLSLGFANIKGEHCKRFTKENSTFELVSVAKQTSLNMTGSKTPKTGFLTSWHKLCLLTFTCRFKTTPCSIRKAHSFTGSIK